MVKFHILYIGVVCTLTAVRYRTHAGLGQRIATRTGVEPSSWIESLLQYNYVIHQQDLKNTVHVNIMTGPQALLSDSATVEFDMGARQT